MALGRTYRPIMRNWQSPREANLRFAVFTIAPICEISRLLVFAASCATRSVSAEGYNWIDARCAPCRECTCQNSGTKEHKRDSTKRHRIGRGDTVEQTGECPGERQGQAQANQKADPHRRHSLV